MDSGSDEHRRNHRVQIWGMYGSESHRRTGVAVSLAKRMLYEFGKDADIYVVQLQVNADQGPAKRLSERWGF